MKNSQRTFLGALGIGALCASGSIGALLGLVHLYAPSAAIHSAAPVETSPARADTAASLRDRRRDNTEPEPDAKAVIAREVRVDVVVKEGEAQRLLTVAIQSQLSRLGCYGGRIDGTWSDATQAAIMAFNSAQGRSLHVRAPDHALLVALNRQDSTGCASELRANSGATSQARAPLSQASIAPADGSAATATFGPAPPLPIEPASHPVASPVTTSPVTTGIASSAPEADIRAGREGAAPVAPASTAEPATSDAVGSIRPASSDGSPSLSANPPQSADSDGSAAHGRRSGRTRTAGPARQPGTSRTGGVFGGLSGHAP